MEHISKTISIEHHKETVSETTYNCDVCFDSGFIYVDENKKEISLKDKILLTTYPVFVKYCPYCRQSKESTIIPPVYRDCTFDNYDYESTFITDTQRMIYTDIREKSEQSLTCTNGILILGPSGTGKAHLAVSFLKTQSFIGKKCLFVSEHDIVSLVRTNRTDSVRTTILSSFLHVDVLCLVRLGVLQTSWDRSIISQVIHILYEMQKWGIIATAYEYNLEKVIDVEPGTFSKLRSLCPYEYHMDGVNYREKLRVESST